MIEEGSESLANLTTTDADPTPTGGRRAQVASAARSPFEDPTEVALPQPALMTPLPPPVPRKIQVDRGAELERQLDAARIALHESEIMSAIGVTSSDVQSEHEQNLVMQGQIDALRAEVDRLRSALAVADTAPPPAYEGQV
jgi:hypothetical protein